MCIVKIYTTLMNVTEVTIEAVNFMSTEEMCV